MSIRVIQEHDLVRVIEPTFVERVGYPLTLEFAENHCEATFEKEVSAFCNDIIEKYKGAEGSDLFFGYTVKETKFYYEVMKAVASHHMRAMRFGGSERSLHTVTHEQVRNTEPWLVTSKRRVKTGTYNAGAYDSFTEDYSPAYLSNEKTHVLLTVEPKFSLDGFLFTTWEIESKNVELIDKK